jgi:hypothetical protein
MRPEEIGRRFGIGVRVAGRIAKDRVESNKPGAPNAHTDPSASAGARAAQSAHAASHRGRLAGRAARAAGRGVGGFLRPFSRVGGILWLEVTGFFFGLFAVFFAATLWRSRTDYAQGPHHQQFLIAAVLMIVFAYLSISSFLRANRR